MTNRTSSFACMRERLGRNNLRNQLARAPLLGSRQGSCGDEHQNASGLSHPVLRVRNSRRSFAGSRVPSTERPLWRTRAEPHVRRVTASRPPRRFNHSSKAATSASLLLPPPPGAYHTPAALPAPIPAPATSHHRPDALPRFAADGVRTPPGTPAPRPFAICRATTPARSRPAL